MTAEQLGCEPHGHINCTACADATVVQQLRAALAAREAEVAGLRAALEFYANPFGRYLDPSGDRISVPDFYAEMEFGDTARVALEATSPPRPVPAPAGVAGFRSTVREALEELRSMVGYLPDHGNTSKVAISERCQFESVAVSIIDRTLASIGANQPPQPAPDTETCRKEGHGPIRCTRCGVEWVGLETVRSAPEVQSHAPAVVDGQRPRDADNGETGDVA